MATMHSAFIDPSLSAGGTTQRVRAHPGAARANDAMRRRLQDENDALALASQKQMRDFGDALQAQGKAMTQRMRVKQAGRFDEMAANARTRRAPSFTDNPNDLSESDNQVRNHYLDMGLNPDNPSEVLTSSMGFGDVGAARRNFAMINAPFFKPGERRLSHSEGSAAVLGAVKNGSEFLDPNDPKWKMRISPGQHTPMRSSGMIKAEADTRRQARVADYGFDPYDSPEAQAEQMRASTGREKARIDYDAGVYRENLRRLGADMRNERRISSGGTIETGGREYRMPMGGGPMFDATPAVEEAMTPEEFVTPAPVRRASSAAPLDMEAGTFSPSRSAAEVVGDTGGMALPPQAAAAQSLQAGVSRFGRQVKDWLMSPKRPLWNHGGARNRRPAPSFGG